jgi:uncharacterized membrane protein
MGKGRLEAFSDGVIAIIITIMVLELKVPHGDDWHALKELLPVFVSYVLSFVNIGIYWSNHHHLFQSVQKVNGKVLWSNIYLLFWLSLVPFATDWMGENHFTELPVAVMGFILDMSGIAYFILSRHLIALHGSTSKLATAVGKDYKGIISLVFYTAAIPLAFVHTGISLVLYVLVAMMWFIPDKRIEKKLMEEVQS